MSSFSDPLEDNQGRQDIRSSRLDRIADDTTEAGSPRRTETIANLFNRHTRGRAEDDEKRTHSIFRHEHRRAALAQKLSRRHTGFHKVLASLFNNNSQPDSQDNHTEELGHQQANSSVSSGLSRSAILPNGSMPSLEFLSPQTFHFSGPSLKSFYSSSLNNSTSQLPSSSGHLAEMNQGTLRRVRSESFSTASVSFLDESMTEPRLILPTGSNLNVSLHRCNSFDEDDLSTFESDEEGITTPPAIRLPNELLQQIYSYLSPRDFDSARRTCCIWHCASLYGPLMMRMLKRGGWLESIQLDLERRAREDEESSSDKDKQKDSPSVEEILSSRLSRECSLSGHRTGNTPIVLVSRTNFVDLASGYYGPQARHSAGLVITASVCLRFLLVAQDSMIYVYGFKGDSLEPLTSVTCPRRVLSMSMDTSGGEFAVAALLDGRMGIWCDLRLTGACPGQTVALSPVGTSTEPLPKPKMTRSRRSSVRLSQRSSGSGQEQPVMHPAPQPWPSSTPSSRVRGHSGSGTGDDPPSSIGLIDVRTESEAITLEQIHDPQQRNRNWINQAWNLRLRGAPNISFGRRGAYLSGTGDIPIEPGPSTIYRHLCFEDDPPRSVAICPGRRAVVFGCSSAVDLHWVDKGSNESLSRQFPLTTPSDFVYFLSQPRGHESANTLRLISSAAHPNDRPNIRRRFSTAKPSPLFLSGIEPKPKNPKLACDHYRAVPLSDGHHILFTDPQSGNLFLGCDAPVGGPTKLLRKIQLTYPVVDVRECPPRLYSAAWDLSWGARIVAVYGDEIVFYSVPKDVLSFSQSEKGSGHENSHHKFPLDEYHSDHWMNWFNEDCMHFRDGEPRWPVTIRGAKIGSLRSTSEVAILTEPDITIWAFSLQARAKVWQLREKPPVTPSKRYITHEGHVKEADGDITMAHAHALSSHDGSEFDDEPFTLSGPNITLNGFDGTNNSLTLAKHIPRALRLDSDIDVEELGSSISFDGYESWYDRKGDIYLFQGSEDR